VDRGKWGKDLRRRGAIIGWGDLSGSFVDDIWLEPEKKIWDGRKKERRRSNQGKLRKG
jgi:hypothetical protein